MARIVLCKRDERRRLAIEKRKTDMGFSNTIFAVVLLLPLAGMISGCGMEVDEGEINSTSDELVAPIDSPICGDEICESSEVGICTVDCGTPPPYIRWSSWLDRDDPVGSGDWETLVDFSASQVGCSLPAYIEAQTTSGVSWKYSGEKLSVSPDLGLTCRNAEQSDAWCFDYRVRFGCVTLDWTALPRAWHEDISLKTGNIEDFVPMGVSVPQTRFVEEMTFGSNGSFSILRLAPDDAHYLAYGTWTRSSNVISVSYYDARFNMSIQETYQVAELTSSTFRFRRM